MASAPSSLIDHPLLTALADLLPNHSATGTVHLVGGAVRDALLDRPPFDFDLASEYDPTLLARALARDHNGHWFWLDEERRQSRVLINGLTFDFAPWRGPTLAEDLAARDFTINAMALDLAGPLIAETLIDPTGGRDDLAGRILRCAGPGVLADDPLRILKGIRHAVELGLSVHPDAWLQMQAAAATLPLIAPERLRLELWRILSAPAGGEGLAMLEQSGAARSLFGPAFALAVSPMKQALGDADGWLAELSASSRAVALWLDESVEEGMNRGILLRWCHLLATIEPSLPLNLARRWRFSRKAISRIAAVCRMTPQHVAELADLPCRPRPIALWALQQGPDPVDLLLFLGLINNRVSKRALLASRLALVASLTNPCRVPPLVDGRWLKTAFGLAGEEVGRALAALRLAEIGGIVANADEARQYLVRSLPKKD